MISKIQDRYKDIHLVRRLSHLILFSVIAVSMTVFSMKPVQAGGKDVLQGIAIGAGAAILMQGLSEPKGREKSRRQYNNRRQDNRRGTDGRPIRRKYLGDSNVRKTQKALTDLGYYAGPINGRKGQKTTQAIIDYQSSKGINPTGVLTSEQRSLVLQDASNKKLARLLGTPGQGFPSLRDQNKGIQAALKILGVYNGSIDGQIGPQSQRSIMAYQRNTGQAPTGVLTPEGAAELIESARQRLDVRLAALDTQFKTTGAPQRGAVQQQTVAGQPNTYRLASGAQVSSNIARPNAVSGGVKMTGAISASRFQPVEKINPKAQVRRKNDIAVIIGNRNYKEGVPPVAFGHRDADAVKAMLVNDLGFGAENIIDLRDAGQGEIRNVFGSEANHKGKIWRFADPDGKSNILVYYSGHGAPDIKSKTPYLVPVDANPNTLEISGYPLTLMYKNLRKIPAKSVTVLLDACFSGDSPNGMLIKSASPLVVTTAPKNLASNFAVLTASTGNQLASWDDLKGHGIFTHYMIEGLKGAADANGDKKVTSGELHAYVSQRVRKSARRAHGRDQNPVLIGSADQLLSVVH